ncbi:MAG TPA: ParB/RepB/Spo0J family partition protein [Atopostipes sp.]|jgi:ParB family chromosome partitioning protein|nr:ParB/RepB/Spo0J family partition protein [Atopostipes sp.]
MSAKKKKGLGQGINALFPEASLLDVENVEGEEKVELISVDEIRSNPYQPRKNFEQEALEELAESIRQSGVLQPIIVRKSTAKGYELVAGERRHKASIVAGLTRIPAIIRELDEEFMIKYAILENLQREDLTPLEEADAYQLMMDKLSLTQERVADALGKSRSHVANHLRLRSLPEQVKQLLTEKKLSMGQARTLRALDDQQAMIRLANKAVKEHLTVRQLEKMVSELKKEAKNPEKPKQVKKKSPFVREYENKLMDKFGTDVIINEKGTKGKIQIEYTSQSDLNRILIDVLDIDLDE